MSPAGDHGVVVLEAPRAELLLLRDADRLDQVYNFKLLMLKTLKIQVHEVPELTDHI